MIPHTPLLLIQAVHALARHSGTVARVRPDLPTALDFVLSIGETAQYDIRVGRSSWPIRPVATYDQLRFQARCQGWMRSRMREGDLLLFRDWTDGGAAAIGIVMMVDDKRPEDPSSVRRCAVAWARSEGPHRMRIHQAVRPCSGSGDDEAIRWYAPPEEVECAA